MAWEVKTYKESAQEIYFYKSFPEIIQWFGRELEYLCAKEQK